MFVSFFTSSLKEMFFFITVGKWSKSLNIFFCKLWCFQTFYIWISFCREDIELIQQEIRQLTEQYSIKCMENATLEEQLDVQSRALQESRGRVHQLMTRWEIVFRKVRINAQLIYLGLFSSIFISFKHH